MTNPPQSSDERGEAPGGTHDPDRDATRPVPSFERPQQYGAPQHGPPRYGAPGGAYGPPAPATKSRVGLIAAVTAGFLVLIAGAVVLALSLSSTVLDRNAVERDVAAQFEEREGVAIDLSCAEEMKVGSGATYACTGTTADGEDVTLQITITDEDTAAYTWTEP